jgi:peroxiredoxin
MIDAAQTPAAPDFSAADSEGRVIHLLDYRGKKNLVIVFNRGFF